MLPDQDALHAAMAEARVGPLLEQAVAQAADETLTDYAPALKTLECERARRAGQLAGPGGAAPAVLRRAGREGPAGGGALMLKLRLDRIDALDDGRKVIVDYTGASAAKPEPDWSRRRP